MNEALNEQKQREGFDLIGDIHGHAAALRRLLNRLGYAEKDGCYRHPRRRAIFVGDFIDRGPAIRETLHIVRQMVDRGAALAVVGNHEFNALCFHTPAKVRGHLRQHNEKNFKQHEATLAEFANAPEEWADVLSWFRSLPLWLDLPGLRVVHAGWDDAAIRVLGQEARLVEALLIPSSARGTPGYDAIETLLKGRELRLPDGYVVDDKEGFSRSKIRVKWWLKPTQATYQELSWPDSPAVPDLAVPSCELASFAGYGADAPPVFVGHYWMPPHDLRLAAPNVACLDFSVAKCGLLVAYRWDGEQHLDPSKFACDREIDSSSRSQHSLANP